MRAAGTTLRVIADQLGVSFTTVLRWTDDEMRKRELARARDWKESNAEHVRAYDAAYHDAHRGRCIRCDGQMGNTSDGVCLACRSAACHGRRMLIVTWWADGMSMPDICARLRWTRGALSVEMVRMRAAGYDLPYRYRGYPKHAKAAA